MKKWLFILLFLVALVYAVFQSSIGQNLIRNIITSAINSSGYTVTIGQVEGTLPNDIKLKDVNIEGEKFNAHIEKVDLRPILWRLIKKELAFKNIHAEGVSLNGKEPFNFDGKFRINAKKLYAKGAINNFEVRLDFYLEKHLAYFALEAPEGDVKGRGTFSPEYELLSASVQLSSSTLLPKVGFEGTILAGALIREQEGVYRADIQWRIKDFREEGRALGAIQGDGEALWQNQNLNLELKSDSEAKLAANLTIEDTVSGSITLDVESLESLHLPKTAGSLHATCLIEEGKPIIDAEFTNLYKEPFSFEKLHIQGELTGPISIAVTNGAAFDLTIKEGQIDLEKKEQSYSYALDATGEWNKEFTISSSGEFIEGFTLKLAHLSGSFAKRSILLIDPIDFVYTEEKVSIPDAKFSVDGSESFINVKKEGDSMDAEVHLENIPLEFFSLNPINTEIIGALNLDAEFKEKNAEKSGTFTANFSESAPFDAFGNMQGTFAKNLLNVTSSIQVRNSPLLDLEAEIPLSFSLFPLHAEIHFRKKAKGNVLFDGRVEELLDFFHFGPHRLEADLKMDLSFTNTLEAPIAKGEIHLTNGNYENYYTGTILKNITADFSAEGDTLLLQKLTAVDEPNSGAFKAEGYIDLIPFENYPYKFEAEVENFQFTQIDLVSASATGNISIKGNTHSGLATGYVELTKSELTIPEKIPSSLPNLEVTYRNENRFIPPPEPEYTPYPLLLDLAVLAPAIHIGGRGLDSKWEGKFNLRGSLSALATEGKMKLVDGQFSFSTRKFKLTEGSLTFTGKEQEMPHLNIAGNTETKGILITARLNGPLDNPQITLQSTPALPLSSIMSYLLFGQDVPEIGGFQALQLATSLASLAGTGPDVLETTRKSLGVDRLQLVTDTSDDGEEKIALSVGKYVTEGVLVSFTQGAEESSTNISVEIELKGNFVFQIESDQRQEQGRFTLKWSRSY